MNHHEGRPLRAAILKDKQMERNTEAGLVNQRLPPIKRSAPKARTRRNSTSSSIFLTGVDSLQAEPLESGLAISSQSLSKYSQNESESSEGLSVRIPEPTPVNLEHTHAQYSPRTPLSPRHSENGSPRARSCRISSWKSDPQEQPASAPLCRKSRSYSCETILAGAVRSPPPNSGSIEKNLHRRLKVIRIDDSPHPSPPTKTPSSPSSAAPTGKRPDVSKAVSPRSLLAIGPKDIVALSLEQTSEVERSWAQKSGKRGSAAPLFRPQGPKPFVRSRAHTMSMKLKQKELDRIKRATPPIKRRQSSREQQRPESMTKGIEGEVQSRQDEIQRALRDTELMVLRHTVVSEELKLREEQLSHESKRVRSSSLILPQKDKEPTTVKRRTDPVTTTENQEVMELLQAKPALSERQIISVLYDHLKQERALNSSYEIEIAMLRAKTTGELPSKPLSPRRSTKNKAASARIEQLIHLASKSLEESLQDTKLKLLLKEVECKEKDAVITTLRTANEEKAANIVRLERLLSEARAKCVPVNPLHPSVQSSFEEAK